MNEAPRSKRPAFRVRDLLAGTSFAACLAAASSSASAATATKSGTGTDLTGASSGVWSGGSGTNGSPTSADIATWGTTSLGAGLTVGANVNWGSISISGALSNIDITGAGTITTGAISLAGSQTLSIASAITVSGGPTWSIADVTNDANADATLSGTISDAGGFTKTGAGTLNLTGTGNNFGLVSINNGTLLVSGGTNTLSATGLELGNDASGANANFFNMTGGQWTENALTYIGNNTAASATTGVSTVNFSGGTFTSAADFNLGVRRSAVMNVSNGASVNLAKITTLWQGNATAGSTATLNLDGGTLTASAILENSTAFAFTVNLNGGLLKAGAAGTLLNSNLTQVNIRNGGAFIDTNGFNTTIAAALQHSNIGGDNAMDGGLTKSGTGTLTLSGANTYTGGTAVTGGYLTFANASAVPGTGLITVNGNGSLVATGAQTTVMGWLGSGQVAAASTGSIAISGNSSENIDFTANGGFNSLGLSSTGTATYSGTITAGTNGYVFGGDTSSNLTVASGLTGASALTKNGAGTLVLTGANTYTGTTTVNSGTLQIGNGGSAGSLGNGAIINNGALIYSLDSNSTASLPSGGITGAGSVTATAKNLTLNGNVTTGGNQSYTASANGGTYQGLSVNASTVTLKTTGGAPISLSGDVGKQGSPGNALNLDTSNGNGTINLNISLGRGNVFFNLTSFSANAGTGPINWTGTHAATSNQSTPITLTGAINFQSNFVCTTAETMTLNAAGPSTVGGSLSGALSLVKGGTDTLTLSGANTFSGTTTVSSGTLLVTGSLGDTAVTVNSGGTFGGTGSVTTTTINKGITLASGGKLDPGTNGSTGMSLSLGSANLDISAGVSGANTGALLFNLADPNASDKFTLTSGTLVIGNGQLGFSDFAFSTGAGFAAGNYTLFSDAGLSGTLNGSDLTGTIGGLNATLGISGNDIVLNVVPEPGAATALFGGVAMLLGLRRRTRLV